MHIIHRWKALGAFFLCEQKFPPEQPVCYPTHCYTTWHTYFMDTVSYPRSSCRPVAWKKNNFKCLGCFMGKGLDRNRIPEGHSWQRWTISAFLSSTILNSTSAPISCFLSFVSEIMLKAPYWKYILQLRNLGSGKDSNGCLPNWENRTMMSLE